MWVGSKLLAISKKYKYTLLQWNALLMLVYLIKGSKKMILTAKQAQNILNAIDRETGGRYEGQITTEELCEMFSHVRPVDKVKVNVDDYKLSDYFSRVSARLAIAASSMAKTKTPILRLVK